jgi:hypothetical protein
VRDEAPVVAHANSSFGTRARAFGTPSYLEGRGGSAASDGLGGGVTVAGARLEGLTALATATCW